jgi:dsRNA-specific ribonuclease
MESKGFEKRVETFLWELLPKFIGKESWVERMISLEDNQKIWQNAFTHSTFDPDANYEQLEFIGDTLCKPAFCKYLLDAYPKGTFSEMNLTELNNVYMAKVEQAKYAQLLGIDKMLRIDPKNRSPLLRIYTDMFEAFVGAVFETGENNALGAGFVLVRAFIGYLFNPPPEGLDQPIDLKKGLGAPKTQVIQIFQRFNLFDIMVEDERVGYGFKSYILITQKYLDQLKKFGVRINLVKDGSMYILGTGTGNTENASRPKAWEDALNKLKKADVTLKWADENKSKFDLDKKEIQPYREQLLAHAKNVGYANLQFIIPPKLATKTTSLVQLVGTKTVGLKKGKQEVIESISSNTREGGYVQAKLALIKMFLSN